MSFKSVSHLITERKARGARLHAEGRVREADPRRGEGYGWIVESPCGNAYRVTLTHTGAGYACTCPDFTERCEALGILCKHAYAARTHCEARRVSPAARREQQEREQCTNLLRIVQSTARVQMANLALPASTRDQWAAMQFQAVALLRQGGEA